MFVKIGDGSCDGTSVIKAPGIAAFTGHTVGGSDDWPQNVFDSAALFEQDDDGGQIDATMPVWWSMKGTDNGGTLDRTPTAQDMADLYAWLKDETATPAACPAS